jgi:hypothetical protein
MTHQTNRDPLRKIIGRRSYTTPSHPHGAWSVVLKLECGHESRCKGSKEPKRRARCRECAYDQEQS